MAKKLALGKGLNALLPSTDPEGGQGGEGTRVYTIRDQEAQAGMIAEVQLSAIRPNPYQPRRDFEEEALDELSASIKQLGIVQPLTVRSLGEGQFELISGERRLRAARKAGLETVPAYVREADSEAMLEMAIVENIQRESLNPIEIALGYNRLMEECGLTQEKVATKVGKKRATVANFLRLLKLPPKVQAALRDGSISMGHARALISVSDEKEQTALLDAIINDNLNVRDVEQRVRRWQEATQSGNSKTKGGKKKKLVVDSLSDADRDALQLQEYANRLRSHFSTQVHIKQKGGNGGGRLEFEYYSNEDFERLMELFLDS